ncbi:hypothetical protein [Pedobacter frigoris]|uniref:hypothetical protein n=1 Tax=Pedobacter frigoris TaxID=2571272 RepID=UPI002931B8C9|nr:hypothetical protein [Pedobacter frigoris]
MTTKTKKIFLAFTIVVPFIVYCVIYYIPMFKNAPFKSTEFVSIIYKWGPGENLENSYNSATGEYHYKDTRDSLVTTNVKLRSNDIIYLHGKANELGFWNFPEIIANKGTDLKTSKVLRYVIQFNYKRKSKTVTYLTDYNEIPKLQGLAKQMTQLIEQSINDAEQRYSNK